jgi:iron complex outermembrane receptor protein
MLNISMLNSQSIEQIDEIIVLEKRISTPYSEQARNIIVITADEIKNAPSTNISDLLNYFAGVDVRQRGPNGVQADAGIRGGTFEQVLILLNGIKISDPQTGHHSLNLPVDIQNIERIEILKGPGARIFGQNAFTGAINIITKTPEKNALSAGVSYGENALLGANISAAFSKKSLHQYISASHDQSDGYKYNTDFTRTNVFYQSKLDINKGSLGLMAGFTTKEFGANGFYASPDYVDQWEAIQNSLVSLQYKQLLSEKVSLKTSLNWRRNQDEYVFLRQDPHYFRNFHINNTLGAEVNTSIYNTLGALGLGVEFNKVWLSSNNLGQRSRETFSLYIEQRMNLLEGKLSITPGIQFNAYRTFELLAPSEKDTSSVVKEFDYVFLPGLDIGYQITEKITAFGNVGYTYRLPSFTDLYYYSPVNHGNSDLKAENAFSFELGLKTKKIKGFDAQASFFYRKGNNIIDWLKINPDDTFWTADNLQKLSHYGIDGNISFYFSKPANKEHFWFDYLNLGFTYIESDVINEGNESKYALENLKYQFTSNLKVNYISDKLFQTVSARYFDRVNLENYFVVNTRLTWQAKKISVHANVNNIFNEIYKETNLVTMPGTWVSMGLSVDIF